MLNELSSFKRHNCQVESIFTQDQAEKKSELYLARKNLVDSGPVIIPYKVVKPNII